MAGLECATTRDGVLAVKYRAGANRLALYPRLGGPATFPISNEELGFVPYHVLAAPAWYDTPYVAVCDIGRQSLALIDRRTSRMAPGMVFDSMGLRLPTGIFYGLDAEERHLFFDDGVWKRNGSTGQVMPLCATGRYKRVRVDPVRPSRYVRDGGPGHLFVCEGRSSERLTPTPRPSMSVRPMDGRFYCWNDRLADATVYQMDGAKGEWRPAGCNYSQLQRRLEFGLVVGRDRKTPVPRHHVRAGTNEVMPCDDPSSGLCVAHVKFYGRDEYVCAASACRAVRRGGVVHSRHGEVVHRVLLGSPFGRTVGPDVVGLVEAYMSLPDPKGPKRLAAELDNARAKRRRIGLE